MPFTPNLVERAVLLRFNQGPGPLLDVFQFLGFRAVLAGVRLGLFDALAKGPATADEIARALGADPRGTRLLLDALEPLGYVRVRGDRYENSPMAAKWMVRASPTALAPAFDFWGRFPFEHWERLDETVRTGKPPAHFYEYLERHPETSLAFQRYMVALARFGGDDLARKVPVPPGARRFLDVGGGHGMYAAALLKRHPGLEATIVDSPVALEAAKEVAEQEGLRDRMRLQPGDFMRDDLGTGYDGALLFNIVHGLSAEENEALARRVAAALAPGGTVSVVEQLESKVGSPTARAGTRLMALNFYHMLGAQTYRFEDVKGWLERAGFTDVRKVGFVKAPGLFLVHARKPA